MQAIASEHPDRRVRRRVLIVEDEVLIRATLSEILRDADIEVLEAASADEALTLLSSQLELDLVLTDVRMPGSIDGLELARILRAGRPGLKIAVTSANLAQWPSADLADAFFPKPYRFSAIVESVLRLIDEPRP